MKKLFMAIILIAAGFFFTACKKEPTEKLYTVTFDSNGGTPVEIQKVKPNDFIKEPNNPTKEGKVFGGWYIVENENSLKMDFRIYRVRKDLKLVAKWQ